MAYCDKSGTFHEEQQFLKGMIKLHNIGGRSEMVQPYCKVMGLDPEICLKGYIKSLKTRKKWNFEITEERLFILENLAKNLLKLCKRKDVQILS